MGNTYLLQLLAWIENVIHLMNGNYNKVLNHVYSNARKRVTLLGINFVSCL
jgi:hypothetical protein